MGSFCGRVLRLRLNGERSGAVSTPTCETSTRSNRTNNPLLALSVCILAFAAFLVSPALALADNGNGNGNGNANAAATSTTSDPAAATTTGGSGDPTTTTSAHDASRCRACRPQLRMLHRRPTRAPRTQPVRTARKRKRKWQRQRKCERQRGCPGRDANAGPRTTCNHRCKCAEQRQQQQLPERQRNRPDELPRQLGQCARKRRSPRELGSRRKRECVGQREPGQAEERKRRRQSRKPGRQRGGCAGKRRSRCRRCRLGGRLGIRLRFGSDSSCAPAVPLQTQTQPREAQPRPLHKQIPLQAKRFRLPTPHRAARLAASPVRADSVQPLRHLRLTANRRRIRIRARRLRTSMGSLVTRRPVVTRARVLPETQIPTRRRRV